MRQKQLLDSIKNLLAHFVNQVEISTMNSEYDINHHAENVLIPILNIVFDVNLKNANDTESKNVEAIDLFDSDKKIAFQITSTSTLEKIKNTLIKLSSSKFKDKVDTIYVYILTKRQNGYSQNSLNKIVPSNLKFDVNEHILDATAIYGKIKSINELDKIEKIESLLSRQFGSVHITPSFSLADLQRFREAYYKSCITKFSRINFFGLSVSTKPREVELYKLFVHPRFNSDVIQNPYKFEPTEFFSAFSISDHEEQQGQGRNSLGGRVAFSDYAAIFSLDKIFGESSTRSNWNLYTKIYGEIKKTKEIPLSELLLKSKHLVVLGKPGAGKSSFVKYTICKLLEGDKDVFKQQDILNLIPFRIELHKYNLARKGLKGGIINYICNVLDEEYHVTIDANSLKVILNTFPVIVFFDGLDEIFEIQARVDVRDEIEAFTRAYSKTRSLVTSRYESYTEVKLSHKVFDVYNLLDFDEKQINEYVNKWYDLEAAGERNRDQEVENCLIQLRSVPEELKCSPLLLSLILILYRNELDIPTSKLRIYEGCTHTLVDKRDSKEKNLGIKLLVKNKVAVFASLAYWQFGLEISKHENISNDDVLAFLKRDLLAKRFFEDDIEAENAAREFLEFALLRSIYFENKFTHKTFFEYFTAYYIYASLFSKGKYKDVDDIITKGMGVASWSTVLELLICLIDANLVDFDVIDAMIESQVKENKVEAVAFFLSIIRYIKNVSKKKVESLVEDAILICVDNQNLAAPKNKLRTQVFNALVQNSRAPGFEKLFINAFVKCVESKSVPLKELCVLAYEFSIVTGRSELIGVISANSTSLNGDMQLFVLNESPQYFNSELFLQSLKTFIERFGTSATHTKFNSLFGQPIFLGRTEFNWVMSYISYYIAKFDLLTLYQNLIAAGVPYSDIVSNISSKPFDVNIIDLKDKLDAAQKSDIKGFNGFVASLRKTYLPKEESGDKGKFYDYFYKSHWSGKKR